MSGSAWIEAEDGTLINIAHYGAVRICPTPSTRAQLNDGRSHELQAHSAYGHWYTTLAHGGEASMRAVRELLVAALDADIGFRIIRIGELLGSVPTPDPPAGEAAGGRRAD